MTSCKFIYMQWRRYTKACPGMCQGGNTFALAAKSGNKNYKSKYFPALADATNDLSKPCHVKQTGAAIVCMDKQ